MADTINGDELVFHPHRPETIFALPIDGGAAVRLEGDLLNAIEWALTSGMLTEPLEEREFEPAADEVANKSAAADPEGESLDDIYELRKAWGKRHKVRRFANAALKKEVKPGQTTRVLYEGVLWTGVNLRITLLTLSMGRVVTMMAISSLDRFQAQSIWEMSANVIGTSIRWRSCCPPSAEYT